MTVNKLLTPAEILAQADRFEKAAKSLRQAASILTDGVVVNELFDNAIPVKKGRRGTKAHELVEFLRANGPMRRIEILQRCKAIKPNTIKFLIGDKRYFDKDDEGRYFART